MREVRLGRLAGPVQMREEHLLARPLRRAPLLHVPPQRAQLAVAVGSALAILQDSESVLALRPELSLSCRCTHPESSSEMGLLRVRHDSGSFSSPATYILAIFRSIPLRSAAKPT